MAQRNQTSLDDRISSNEASGLALQMKNVFTDELTQQYTRDHITKVVCDYIDTVPFMKKVKEYAGDEFDIRTLKNIKFWFSIIAVTIVTTAITVYISSLITKK
jgi:hypothetical protein